MVEAYDKVVQVRVRVPSWFTFREKVQPMTLIANTYNLTCQKPYLLYKQFCCDIFYYICRISHSAVTSFSIFVVLVVLLCDLLSYSLYQLFWHGILYHFCCISCSAMASFIILAVLVGLPWHPLLYLLYRLFNCVSYFCHFTFLCCSWPT